MFSFQHSCVQICNTCTSLYISYLGQRKAATTLYNTLHKCPNRYTKLEINMQRYRRFSVVAPNPDPYYCKPKNFVQYRNFIKLSGEHCLKIKQKFTELVASLPVNFLNFMIQNFSLQIGDPSFSFGFGKLIQILTDTLHWPGYYKLRQWVQLL